MLNARYSGVFPNKQRNILKLSRYLIRQNYTVTKSRSRSHIKSEQEYVFREYSFRKKTMINSSAFVLIPPGEMQPLIVKLIADRD